MKLELISIETAKLARNKGFDWQTHDYFSKDKYDKKLTHHIGYDDEYWGDNYEHDWNTFGEPFKPFTVECYSRPSQELLKKWLREEHKIHLETPVQLGFKHWNVQLLPTGGWLKPPTPTGFNSYEQALEKGLQEALNQI